MERRTYTKEFKQEAVELSHESESSIVQVAQNLGIRPELLYRWRAEERREGNDAFPGKGKVKPSEEEVHRLRRELEEVRRERDILKHIMASSWYTWMRRQLIDVTTWRRPLILKWEPSIPGF